MNVVFQQCWRKTDVCSELQWRLLASHSCLPGENGQNTSLSTPFAPVDRILIASMEFSGELRCALEEKRFFALL